MSLCSYISTVCSAPDMATTDSGSGGSSNNTTNTSSVLSSIVGSYGDRSDSCSNPSLVRSMLRNTTETGDIGIFSIVPDSVPLPPSHSRRPNRVKSRASTTSRRRKRPILYSPEPRLNSQASLRQLQAEEALSLYRAGTPSSLYTRASSARNDSQVTLSDLRSPSQADFDALPRSPSPFAHPARLKRPGYRSSSPCLAEFHRTEARAYVGFEPGHISHPPAVLLQHKSSDMRSKYQGTDTGFVHDPRPRLTHDSRPPPFPTTGNPKLQRPSQAHFVQSMSSRESLEAKKANTADQQCDSVQEGPSMTYYDYSENFGEFPNRTTKPQTDGQVDRRYNIRGRKVDTKHPSRANTTIPRAQTSMIVNVSEDIIRNEAESRNKSKGSLAEWEQLGLSSQKHRRRISTGQSSNIASESPISAEAVAADPQQAASGFPVALMDDSGSYEAPVNKQGSSGSQESSDTFHSATETKRPDTAVPEIRTVAVDQNENSSAPNNNPLQKPKHNETNAPKKTRLELPRIDTSVGLVQPETAQVAARADVPIQSPKPERPLSYRNPNDRLSRILSIDESYSGDEELGTKPGGKRPADRTKGKQSISHGKASEGSSENSNTTTCAETHDRDVVTVSAFQWPFRRLKDHFKRSESPQMEQDDSTEKQENVPAQKAAHETCKVQPNGLKKQQSNPLPIQNGPIFDKTRVHIADSHATTLQKGGRFLSDTADSLGNKPPNQAKRREAHSPAEKDRLQTRLGRTNIQQLSEPENRTATPFSFAPSQRSADFLTSSSPAKSQAPNSPNRNRISSSAPRIKLHPPTPSLGLQDLSSIFTNSDFQTPPHTSSGIVDAEVIESRHSSEGPGQERRSRRWTKVSSFFNSTRSTSGISGTTDGLTWMQYTRWKLGEKMKQWSGTCLGHRKTGRPGSSIEMH